MQNQLAFNPPSPPRCLICGQTAEEAGPLSPLTRRVAKTYCEVLKVTFDYESCYFAHSACDRSFFRSIR